MAGNRKVMLAIGPAMAPVSVSGAVTDEDETSDLRTVCNGKKVGEKFVEHPPVRVNQYMNCPEPKCGRKERSHHPYPRGRENPDGTISIVAAEALESAGVDQHTKDVIDLLFAPRDQVDALALPHGKVYYLSPADHVGASTYGLFRDAIITAERELGLVPVTIWAYTSAPRIVRIVPMGDVLTMHQIAWPQAIKPVPNVTVPEYKASTLPLVMSAIESLTTDFSLETFVDVRQAKLAEIIASASAVQAGTASVASTPVDGGADAMVASLQDFVAKKGKAVVAKGQTAKKTAAKKTTASRKKTA